MATVGTDVAAPAVQMGTPVLVPTLTMPQQHEAEVDALLQPPMTIDKAMALSKLLSSLQAQGMTEQTMPRLGAVKQRLQVLSVVTFLGGRRGKGC